MDCNVWILGSLDSLRLRVGKRNEKERSRGHIKPADGSNANLRANIAFSLLLPPGTFLGRCELSRLLLPFLFLIPHPPVSCSNSSYKTSRSVSSFTFREHFQTFASSPPPPSWPLFHSVSSGLPCKAKSTEFGFVLSRFGLPNVTKRKNLTTPKTLSEK